MRKFVFYLFLSLASIIACLKLHEYAASMRFNTDAWGGELMLLFIPYMVWLAIRNFKDTVKALKEVDENA